MEMQSQICSFLLAIQFYINQEMETKNGVHFNKYGLDQMDKLIKTVAGKGIF